LASPVKAVVLMLENKLVLDVKHDIRPISQTHTISLAAI